MLPVGDLNREVEEASGNHGGYSYMLRAAEG